LIKFLFDYYIESEEERDAVDSNGNTGIHLLVQSKKRNTTLGETILNLLIKKGCCVNIVNGVGKTPIEYLNRTDQGYIVLSNAEKETNGINFIKQDYNEN